MSKAAQQLESLATKFDAIDRTEWATTVRAAAAELTEDRWEPTDAERVVDTISEDTEDLGPVCLVDRLRSVAVSIERRAHRMSTDDLMMNLLREAANSIEDPEAWGLQVERSDRQRDEREAQLEARIAELESREPMTVSEAKRVLSHLGTESGLTRAEAEAIRVVAAASGE